MRKEFTSHDITRYHSRAPWSVWHIFESLESTVSTPTPTRTIPVYIHFDFTVPAYIWPSTECTRSSAGIVLTIYIYIYIYIVKNVSFQVLLAGYNLLLKNWRHSKWPTGLPRVNSSSAFLSCHIQNLVDKPGIPSMPHQTDVFAVGTCSQEACCLIQVSLSQTGGLVGFGRWRCGPPLTRVTFQGATHACNVNVGWLCDGIKTQNFRT